MTVRRSSTRPDARVLGFLDALAEIVANRVMESMRASSGEAARSVATTAKHGERPRRHSTRQRLRRSSTGSPNFGTLAR